MRNKVVSSNDIQFQLKALDDGSVYIEGWANKAVVDRGGDYVGRKAWNLDNYKKNPIILFNHDHSKPIGKMISVEAKDEGLLVKGRISNSKDPEISRIRDLVQEGILNSLSVGMRVDDEDHKEGVNHIKSAELHEVSIVAIPMNQESLFTVSTKSMQGDLVDVMERITREVGAEDVAKAYHKLHDEKEVFSSIVSASKFIAKQSGIDLSTAESFLKMKLLDTPSEIQQWLKEKQMGMEEDQKPEDQKPEDKEKALDVHGIRVPKESFASMDELLAWAEENGWKSDNIVEEESTYLLVQRPAEDFVGEFQDADMGDNVIGIVGTLKEEVPPAEGEVEVEAPEATSEEDAAAIAERFKVEIEVAVGGEEGNPPSWVADEALWEKAKRASEAALGEVSYAFVVWWYMDQGGSKKGMDVSADSEKGLLDDAMTQPLQGQTAEMIQVNPSLDQAKQTNVLLSSMVLLLQQMNEKLGSEPVLPEAPIVMVEDSADAEVAKKLETFMIKTSERLSLLGL